MLLKKIRKEYKKCGDSIINEINTEAFKIDNKLELDDRISIFPLKQYHITLKDHKADFKSKM